MAESGGRGKGGVRDTATHRYREREAFTRRGTRNRSTNNSNQVRRVQRTASRRQVRRIVVKATPPQESRSQKSQLLPDRSRQQDVLGKKTGMGLRPVESGLFTPVRGRIVLRSQSRRGSNKSKMARRSPSLATPALSKRSPTDLSMAGNPQVVNTPLHPDRKYPRLGRKKRPVSPLMYCTRLLIMGIGVGAIAGTLLSAWDPAARDFTEVPQTAAAPPVTQSGQMAFNRNLSQASLFPTTSALDLQAEMQVLKKEVETLATRYPDLTPGILIVDLDTGAYVDVNSESTFAAASTIKVPILIAFFQDVDAGKISLDETLILRTEHIASGSGVLQYQQPGMKYTALDIATLTIVISDNTATNMLIERLGGATVLNQRFRNWGLTTTAIRNRLPDVEGTNITTPKELAQLMALVDRGDLISRRSRDRLLDIMQETENSSLLKQGLGEGSTIAHKTGTIGSLLADVGLIDMPNGKRYIAAVMVKRPFNDYGAQELINQISRTTYRALESPLVLPSPIPAQSHPSTAPNNPNDLLSESAEATAHRQLGDR